MLIVCPECDLQVSDKALVCPHCGYPITEPIRQKRCRQNSKRRRLPNGFGQISEIKSHNLRNRWRVMIPAGKNEHGRPISKPLKPQAYFATYNEAYAALVEYHKDPYIMQRAMTIEELYDQWRKTEYFDRVSAGYIRNINSAWKASTSLYTMKLSDLKAFHIKTLIDSIENPNSKERVKSMFNIMLDYALSLDLVDKNYSRNFKLDKSVEELVEEQREPHIAFSEDEMKILWKYKDIGYVDIVLIQCYTGWRPQELGLLKMEDVHLDENYITGGMKTDAGKRRIVPIIPKIKGLVERRYEEAQKLNSDYIFNCTDTDPRQCKTGLKLTYDKYKYRYNNIIAMYGLNSKHRPHDPRVDFATRCKKNKVDEYALKYIIGHKIRDITESVYTERDHEWLYEELLKTEDSI